MTAQNSWKNVRKTKRCWFWLRAKAQGYGRVYWEGRVVQATRVSWLLCRGPIPDGKWILHKCDNPACVRPSHLFLGTAKTNAEDCRDKGRLVPPRGTRNGNSKLTDPIVRVIRQIYRKGSRQFGSVALGRRLQISDQVILDIMRHRRWRHI